MSTEKSDTLIYGVPAEWAQRAHVDAAKYKEHVRVVRFDAGCVLGGAWQADRLDQAVHEGEEHLLSIPARSRSNGSRTAPRTWR